MFWVCDEGCKSGCGAELASYSHCNLHGNGTHSNGAAATNGHSFTESKFKYEIHKCDMLTIYNTASLFLGIGRSMMSLICHGIGRWTSTIMRPRPFVVGRDQTIVCRLRQSTIG